MFLCGNIFFKEDKLLSFLPLSVSDLLSSFCCVLVRLNLELKIAEFNDNAEKLYSCSSEIAIGNDFFKFCNSRGIAPPLNDFSLVLEGTNVTKLSQTVLSGDIVRHIQWHIFSIFDVVDMQKVSSILLVGTEENLLEKMKEKILNFENILNHVPNAIFWKDKNSVFLGCNEEFAQMANLKFPRDIIGKSDYDLPWSRQETISYIADDKYVIENNEARLNIEEKLTKNGNQLFLSTSKVPLYNANKEISGVLGVFSDITERKKMEKNLELALEKAEAASQAKTIFLQNMRHDIRTPLSGIVGFADLIRGEVSDPKMKEYASNLSASGYALTDLLDEVLEAITVSSGEIPVLKKKFILEKKLNEIISLNKARALYKKIDLLIDYDTSIPNYLIGDSARIYRVVLELITNALTFTHKGHVKLSAQLAQNNEDDVVVKIMVEDTGIGIAPERQQDIYLQFKRLTPSYEGVYKGYGLGLFIAKQLIDDLNGEIYVESKVGVGSKFVLVIKLKRALLDEEYGSEELIPSFTPNQFIPLIKFRTEKISEEETESYKSSILVVEDSSMAADALIGMLSKMDCLVDLAERGEQAIDFSDHKQYDLIFMDIGLPGIDGYETTRRIRLNELKKNHVPIIALTAHASEENKKYCIDMGMNAVLTKPLIQEKAEDILNSFIPYRRERLKVQESIDSIEKNTPYEELPIFDFELLKERLGGESMAIGMAKLCLQTLPKELQELQVAHTQGAWSLVKNLTHKMKGGVSYCSAPRLEEACSQLEDAIRNGENACFETLYEQLLKAAALTEEKIKEKFHT